MLVREENAENVVDALKNLVALWSEDEPHVEICQPCAGAGLVKGLGEKLVR